MVKSKVLSVMAVAVALFSAPMLASCGTIGTDPGGIQLSQTTADDKALVIAEAAYFGVATAAEVAVDTGALKGPAALQVANHLQTAYGGLQVARSAHRAGNARSARVAISEALEAVAQAQRLIRPQPG